MHPVPLSAAFDLDFHLTHTVADYARPGLESLKDRLLAACPYA